MSLLLYEAGETSSEAKGEPDTYISSIHLSNKTAKSVEIPLP